jgi:hypothetical protein
LWIKDFLNFILQILSPVYELIKSVLLSIFKYDHATSTIENSTNTEKHDIKIIFRPIAILAACLVIVIIFEKKLPKSQIIRFLAYYLDYYEAPLYPNLKANKKFRLHANGIVSYAFIDGFEVTISIEDYNKN